MKFKQLRIQNYRNYEDTTFELSNKNIIFGRNDVGKTNCLHAIRCILDRSVRQKGFVETDYHNCDTDLPISISITIELDETEDQDSDKIRAHCKGAIRSKSNTLCISLKAQYDAEEQEGNPKLSWGPDFDHLEAMPQNGTYWEVDRIFNLTYIDSYTDLQKLFKNNIQKIAKSYSSDETTSDLSIREIIDKLAENINVNVGKLSYVKQLESELAEMIHNYDTDVDISIKSELAINGVDTTLNPYVKRGESDKLYPTSGEGRRKLLSYVIYKKLNKIAESSKVNIVLVEEPENNLHRSLQIALSRHLLGADSCYPYIFLSTHSPYVVYEMDDVRLIRIFGQELSQGASTAYTVPEDMKHLKKILTKQLAEAIFSDKVLLVEGPSEYVLFSHILEHLIPNYESRGMYILPVNGISFKPYYKLLKDIEIKVYVKTDNDIQKIRGSYHASGLERCCNLVYDPPEVDKHLQEIRQPTIENNDPNQKRILFQQFSDLIKEMAETHNVFLSEVDLENDLHSCLSDSLDDYLKDNSVEYMQSKKHYVMVELIENIDDKGTYELFDRIVNNSNFQCLKRFVYND